MEAQHSNRLVREKSPYLLQHAHNPVDWFAWSEEAFARARAESKPIFLSIGYSTCHWCHVMERESFENETVAAFLRENFISIKVDREERPDVDKIYMTFVQATSGRGGWPLNVFLTPELKPFFGGTYFPPDHRHGTSSFLEILQQIAQLWRERRPDIAASANDLHGRLALFAAQDRRENTGLAPEMLHQALAMFEEAYDPANGGFGGAPKFPQPAVPSFILRAAKRFGDREAVDMVLHTCAKMAAGGIHDQLGGGFARYSVDERWLVPHFEKMLYDNAQLAQLYLDACLVSQAPDAGAASPVPPAAELFAATARDILDYVLRDMTHPDGGFYSAEDADSEGHEGKFYCWTKEELSKLLSSEEFAVAADYFGITPQGNFVDHSHPHPLSGQNVLSLVHPLSGDPGAAATLASAKTKMLAARAQRVRPHLDDKVLASWNGLMLGAFARASVVLDDARYRLAAVKNLAFLRARLWVAPDKLPATGDQRVGTLFHRWRDGEHDQIELLEGYAFVLAGVIELYEATLEPGYLEFACELAEALLAKFHDPDGGGFWQSPADRKDLILRVKDDYDGAEPSGNSVATQALLKLAALTDRADFQEAAEATLHLSAARLQTQPAAVACMLQALDFWVDEPWRVVIAGEPGLASFQTLLRAAHSVYQPHKIVLGTTGPVEPFATSLTAQDGPKVYLCTGDSCQPPTSDPAAVRRQLLRSAG
jgi:uncharacterized protein YyaL (SSP411 family)